MTPSRSRWWARKDAQRITQRLGHGADELTGAEREYLRNWALLLAASDLDLTDDDLAHLRQLAAVLDQRERAA